MFKKKRKEKPSEAPAREQTPREKPRVSRWKLWLALGLFLLAAACVGLTVLAYRLTVSPYNLPNVYLKGVYVGGMTEAETQKALENAAWQESAEEPMLVKLPADIQYRLDVVKAGAMLSQEDAAALAVRYGHDGDWFRNLFTYTKNLLQPVDLCEEEALNEAYIQTETAKALALFREKTRDTGHELDEEKSVLRLMKGAGKMQIDEARLCHDIGQALLRGERLLERKLPDNNLELPDFQKLHDTLAAEAQDARYDEKFEVIEETLGFDFDVKAAEEAWRAAKATEYYEFPVQVIQPQVTAEQLRAQLYRDKLGSQTTLYTWSSENRINNIKLCFSKFQGMILYPGDTFSFNEVVGQRTEEAGFLPAGAYADGQVVQEVGGGICQVSSTLYCASMYAQMKTVYRESHYFRVDYLPLGYDATVSWQKPDFKFRNDRDFPVKIVAYCDDEAKSLTVEIWGTDVDGSYVELSYWDNPVYDEEFADVVIGTQARAFRKVYDKDGNFLYRVDEPYSMYHLHEDEIQWPEEEEEGEEGEEKDPFEGLLPDPEDWDSDDGIIIVP